MASYQILFFLLTITGAAAYGLWDGLIISAFNSSSISFVNYLLLWNPKLRTLSLIGRLCLKYNLHLTKSVIVAVFSFLNTMLGNFFKRASLFSSRIQWGFVFSFGWARFIRCLNFSSSCTEIISVQKHSNIFT